MRAIRGDVRLRVMLLAVVVALGAAVAPVGAQGLSDLRDRKEELEQERQALQEQQAVLASQLEVEAATAAEIEAALVELQADLDAKQRRLDQANEALARAVDQVAETREAREAALADQAELTTEIQRLAVQAYVAPPGEVVLDALISGNALDAPYRRALLDASSGSSIDALDRFREVQRRLDDNEGLAAEATELARQREQAADRELAAVEEAKLRQQEFAAEVDARIDHLLSEAASLEAIDAEKAAEIRATETEIASKIAEIERAAAAARRRAGSGMPSIPLPGEIVNVQGINVHQSIAGNVDALLTEAAAAGIFLGGGGYRSNSNQIRLRRAHCGASDYAIYQAPASSCRPPTARPGASMHERGMAIDFTFNGRAITSRSSPAFVWLSANASRFGLFNLPSEPWHWSTNGR